MVHVSPTGFAHQYGKILSVCNFALRLLYGANLEATGGPKALRPTIRVGNNLDLKRLVRF